MSTSKRRKRSRSAQFAGWILAIILAVVAFARHTHTTEFVLCGIAAGLIAGAVMGYRRGKASAVIIAPAPKRKPAAPAAKRTPQVRYKDHDPNALLAEMDNWSSACLDGNCGECSGTYEGRKCTHCNHPGRRRGPGQDIDLETDDEEIPY